MVTGSCLCGGIRFELTGPLRGIAHCHCSLCRKVSGAGSFATLSVPAEQLRWISGEELVQQWERPSGYGVSFCRVCGSPAPDPDRARTRWGIPAGLLDGQPDVSVIEHIHVGSRATWDVIGDDGAPRHDEMGP